MVLLGVKGLTQFPTCIVKQLASALSMDSAHEEAQQYFPIFFNWKFDKRLALQ